jgi:hypothetical protein
MDDLKQAMRKLPESIVRKCLDQALAIQREAKLANAGDGDEAARARAQARLLGLEVVYELRLEAMRFPEPDEQITRTHYENGTALASTYRELTKLQALLGQPMTPRDPRISRANSMAMAYYKQNNPAPPGVRRARATF